MLTFFLTLSLLSLTHMKVNSNAFSHTCCTFSSSIYLPIALSPSCSLPLSHLSSWNSAVRAGVRAPTHLNAQLQ